MSTLVIGEALIDEVAFADGSCLRGPGGSMLNVAIGLRRLGRTVRLVTDFGLDPDGEILELPLVGLVRMPSRAPFSFSFLTQKTSGYIIHL